ncbi:AAA family ATPase [Niabella ginsengisoli]|uniref:Uncharacterized protein n=1 Tax=Niabella ginsengisoli TaxID=522298 RepID=A0ABS9SJV5_9BACT|nr:hypothetical protein [Niabella ginsengisoli]MCH5598644.1 hypothetical protein [Niabella ginsengisoli]
MKPTTEKILSILNDENIQTTLQGYVSSNPALTHGDTDITEAVSKFNLIRETLNVTINSTHFDTLPANRRNSILSSLNALKTHISNPSQLIIQIDSLYETILGNELLCQQISKRDYVKEFKNIADLKANLEQLIKDIEEKEEVLATVDTNAKLIETLKKKLSQISDEIYEILENSKKANIAISEVLTSANTSQSNIDKSEKEIEAKRLSITTFAENIEEYKTSISALETQAKSIISKEAKIDELISQAEKALNLKSAEGISAAFSAQYNSSNKVWGLRLWIIGAAVFIIVAICLTIWIVSGYGIINPNSISSIVGRVVAVGIAITGATFCAKQFTKQKNISEDYAYKAVLTKSIIAFTEEIKKRDENKVAEYLEKVLSEIHQDPLRKRTDKEDIDSINKPFDIIGKLIDKIPTTK